MFQRGLITAVAIVALAAPSFAQPRVRANQIPAPVQTNASFRALFKPAVEKPAKSTVRILVSGKEAALGVVVSAEGFIVTKASEIKGDRVSVKTRDGRDFDGKVVVVSEIFDLAVIKVEGTGLTPITWASSTDEPVGNWLAVAGAASDPVAVGVLSTGTRFFSKPYGPRRVPTEKSGFLGVQLEPDESSATIGLVTPDSAAAKAGILAKDKIIRIDSVDIPNADTLINTLLGYKVGDKVAIVLMREGKQKELFAVLGKRPPDPTSRGRGGSSRGDFQNSMGSTLSDRRVGFPQIFQTDAVVKPTDCGGPVVDLDGHAIGLMIARAGRTESWAIPAETMKELVPIMISTQEDATREKRVEHARLALEKAVKDKAGVAVIDEGKRFLKVALAEEKWWKDHPLEKAPAPRVLSSENRASPRAAK